MTPNDKKKLYKAVASSVGKILCEDWDPLEAKDDDNDCSGEYDAYVKGITDMLFEQRSPTMIAEELCFIEEDKMILLKFREKRMAHNLTVAEKLVYEFCDVVNLFVVPK